VVVGAIDACTVVMDVATGATAWYESIVVGSGSGGGGRTKRLLKSNCPIP
jgi:hypothetical protein